MSVTLSNPEESRSGLAPDSKRRRATGLHLERRRCAYPGSGRIPLGENSRPASAAIPTLARSLSETNLYIASLLDTPLAWAYANRSRAQVFYTMRKSLEAEPYFDKAVQLFEQAGLTGEVGRTLVRANG